MVLKRRIDTRWWVLFCCCCIVFFPAFFDFQVSVLVQRLTGTAIECINGIDTCLNFSLYQFNILASMDYWTRAVAGVFAGIIIDKYGTKFALWGSAVGMIVSTLIFTLGSYVKTTTGAYIMMLLGRLLFGLVTGGYSVIIHRVKAGWFKHKELALAFSTEIFFDKFATAIAFLLYGGILGSIGLRGVLWLSFFLTVISAIALGIIAHLDSARTSAMVWTGTADTRPRTIWFSLQYFDAVYWLLVAILLFYEASVQPLIADGPLYFAGAYGYSEATASYLTGLIYDLCFLAPIVGWLTDRYGRRDYGLFFLMAITCLAYLLALTLKTTFPAVLLTLFVGIGFTSYSSILWSSIPLLVTHESIGLALGLGKLVASAGGAAGMVTAGAILNTGSSTGDLPWDSFFIFLLVLSSVCVVISPLIIYLNTMTGYRLTLSQRQKADDAVSEVTPINTSF
ncbi:hypothetical protein RvY_00526 [Ramazzottius varieornatus]|uniref:Lysosomal dipeptide transporter MFSD1 n=1 Tax=Ramazzottius varieornatus TaxID=947166 RepID=A0A1D1UDI6_RAMVA|nr:hypothetical protein RvY_00526 [Ramazzottius varieornatus]